MTKLLSPDPALIKPAGHQPAHDRAPEDTAAGTPDWLKADLIGLLDESKVLTKTIDLIRYATDASPYRMIPKVIVTPSTEDEVRAIFAYARSSVCL